MGVDTTQGQTNKDKLVYARSQHLRIMITYYYDMGDKRIYYSEQDIDYRILSKCDRCIRVEFGNAQILKDTGNEWRDYPMDDKEISWIMLKAKRIPRSWDRFNT